MKNLKKPCLVAFLVLFLSFGLTGCPKDNLCGVAGANCDDKNDGGAGHLPTF